MLHGIKLALSAKGDRVLLETNQRLREADRVLTELRRWFPQLQAAFEENQKIWTSLAYNISTIAKTAQEVYHEHHKLQLPLDSLASAGDCVLTPVGGKAIHDERTRAVDELRAFNDCIRQLRAEQMECVSALKNKEYYSSKLETIRANESKKKKKVTDREADRRLRNEQKLRDYSTQLAYQTDKFHNELHKALDKKELLLEMVLTSYVRTQDFYFALNPMPAVLSVMQSRISPRALYELHGYTNAAPLASLHSTHSDDLAQPPRAPSPVSKMTSNPNGSVPFDDQDLASQGVRRKASISNGTRKKSVRIVEGPVRQDPNIDQLNHEMSHPDLTGRFRCIRGPFNMPLAIGEDAIPGESNALPSDNGTQSAPVSQTHKSTRATNLMRRKTESDVSRAGQKSSLPSSSLGAPNGNTGRIDVSGTQRSRNVDQGLSVARSTVEGIDLEHRRCTGGMRNGVAQRATDKSFDNTVPLYPMTDRGCPKSSNIALERHLS
ncbi:hypothetical protein BWQ96_07126 [Gracilariopsis chorda]|uniref:BAR domain-containing protein n=1 Tax=Gracilariopsis chorda TaxID=448386 RepID=A0A2V3IM74_9FLOR|nr:hypothetical protein BWQ96_07126 [Gracilariopsis chorda]|eukprot:PXF43182.1 hypothetical protein BWQ96_07126 [Gracilariopsis chorda]